MCLLQFSSHRDFEFSLFVQLQSYPFLNIVITHCVIIGNLHLQLVPNMSLITRIFDWFQLQWNLTGAYKIIITLPLTSNQCHMSLGRLVNRLAPTTRSLEFSICVTHPVLIETNRSTAYQLDHFSLFQLIRIRLIVVNYSGKNYFKIHWKLGNLACFRESLLMDKFTLANMTIVIYVAKLSNQRKRPKETKSRSGYVNYFVFFLLCVACWGV
jgi:hypothetical protein